MTLLPDTLVQLLDNASLLPPEHLRNYSVDGIAPEAVIFPSSIGAVSEVLSYASTQGKAVTPWGGGTQISLGNVPKGIDLVLGTVRMDRVLFHEPADLVARVEEGITLAALQQELARRGQHLPIEAPLDSTATIGGILAANASGPSRLAFGTPRDWLIGIKVVQSDGVVTKSGGRVVKNVSGYDLNKLYTGSLGTLGVIVEATFKVAPLPPDARTVVATYSSLGEALESARKLLRQAFTPDGVQVINSEIQNRLPSLGRGDDSGGAVLTLVSGLGAAVRRKADELAKVLSAGGATDVRTLSKEEGLPLWRSLTDLGWAAEGSPRIMAKVSTLPSRVGNVVALSDSLGHAACSVGVVADVGFGTTRLTWWEREDTPASDGSSREVIDRLRQEVRRLEGHAVIERCPLEVKRHIDVWGDSLEGAAIMRRVKQELDPGGILNPGRFAGGI